jgi:hypothetical protein
MSVGCSAQESIFSYNVSRATSAPLSQAPSMRAFANSPNQEKYPNQQILVVEIENSAYLVPFVESTAGRLLKTIVPSRKATRRYLGEQHDKDNS